MTAGLKVVHALMPSPEAMDRDEAMQAIARYQSQAARGHASEQDRVRALEQQAAVMRFRALGPPCEGAPTPNRAGFAGADASDLLRTELAAANVEIQFVEDVPFEAPTGPPGAALRMTILEWTDPTETSGGDARALVELYDAQTDTARCRALVQVAGHAPQQENTSLDGARFTLLWDALRRGTNELHSLSEEPSP